MGQVVPVKTDVERSHRQRLARFDLGELLRKPVGQGNPACLDPDEGDLALGVSFGNFVGNAPDRAAHGFSIHQLSGHLHLLGKLAGSP